MTGRLDVVRAPDRAPGTIIHLNHTMMLGRSKTSPTTSFGSRTIARQHCRFERDGAVWTLRDMGSPSGTFVNRKRVVGVHVLRNGDIIEIGADVGLRFCGDDGAVVGVRDLGGGWVGFSPLRRPGLFHALRRSVHGARVATAWLTDAPVVNLPGTPRLLARVDDGVIIDDVAGVAFVDACAVIHERADVVAPALAVACARAQLACALAGGPFALRYAAWLTFGGALVLLPRAGVGIASSDARAVELYCARVVGDTSIDLGVRFDPRSDADDDDDALVAHARDAFLRAANDTPATPTGEALRHALLTCARDHTLDTVARAVDLLADAVGPVEPSFLAAVVHDLFPDEARFHRDAVEQAAVLGAEGVLALAER